MNRITAILVAKGYSEKTVSSTPTAVMGHGPEGLFSYPGMGGERKRRRDRLFMHRLVNEIGISQEKATELLGLVDKMRESALAEKPGGKSPGKSIKNSKVYEALKRQGYPKSRAAAISNAMVKSRVKSILAQKGYLLTD